MPTFHMRWKSIILLVLGLGLLVYVFLRDPADGLFLPCPLHRFTGWLCPGCGSQRALHDLLHGRIGEAWAHNALLIIGLVTVGSIWGIGRFSPHVRIWAASKAAIWSGVIVVVGWGLMRNVW